MKKYEFEYINHKYSTKLILALFLLFFVLWFLTLALSIVFFTSNVFVFILCSIISAVIPYSIYQINKKKFRKEGYAIINESDVEFNFFDAKKKIDFSEIKNYTYENANAVLLNITLKDNKIYSITANRIYCNTTKLNEFCLAFVNSLEMNNLDLIKEKSCFEKYWIYPILIILTGAIITIIIYAIVTGKQLSSIKLFVATGSLLGLWGRYFSMKNKTRKR